MGKYRLLAGKPDEPLDHEMPRFQRPACSVADIKGDRRCPVECKHETRASGKEKYRGMHES